MCRSSSRVQESNSIVGMDGLFASCKQAISVNTEGMPEYLAAKVQAYAQEGPTALRRFAWRTRMIYGLDLLKIVRVV